MMLVGPGGVDKTRLVTRWPRPWSGRSPRELRSLSWGALPDPVLADGRPMAVTDVKKGMDAAVTAGPP
jgi:hypothetical protein